jgi:hypothetical protein
MASKSNQNIFSQYCMSTRVPGHTCSALRKGVECTYAHTRDVINPNLCRWGECRARDQPFPYTCTYIHKGETKSEYSDRVDFDRNYDCLNMSIVKRYVDECDTIIAALKESNWKRTNTSLHHLNTKRAYLESLFQKKLIALDEWAKKEAYYHRRDKYREQYRERDDDYD